MSIVSMELLQGQEMPLEQENLPIHELPVYAQMLQTLELRKANLLSRKREVPGIKEIADKQTLFLSRFYEKALNYRLLRAGDAESVEIRTADEIGCRVLDFVPYRLGCIDGRNKYVYVFGFTPGIGGDFRIPAGDPQEFVEDSDGKLILLQNSNYANSLNSLLEKSNGKTSTIILDSHMECAAQEAGEAKKKPSALNRIYPDHGLLADVQRKKQIRDAIYRHRNETHADKSLDILQTTYDPLTNFMYIGLEKQEVIERAKEGEGLDQTLLNTLVQEGTIISTQAIAYNDNIRSIFEQNAFIPDWKNNFKATGLQFWKSIEQLVESPAIEIIKEEVRRVCPDITEQQITTRAQLLLLNAFSGYINNESGQVASEHSEEWVVISEREYGPYKDTSGFQVSRHSSDIPGDLDLGNRIVHANRRKKHIRDCTQIYNGDYEKAPLPVMAQVVDKSNLPDWEAIKDQDFSDLSDLNWRDMSEANFRLYLRSKYDHFTDAALTQLNRLREKAVSLLKPGGDTARDIMNGDVHVIYTIADPSRRPLFCLPLEYKGYSNQRYA